MTGIWLVSYVALWLLFLVVSVILLSVLRNLGVIYESLSSRARPRPAPSNLQTGQDLPPLTLRNLRGDETSIRGFLGEKTAFSVITTQCPSCVEFLKTVAAGDSDPDPLDPTVRRRVILSIGDLDRTAELIGATGLNGRVPVLVDTQGMVRQEWGITAAPATVITDDRLKVVRQVFADG